MTAKSRRARRAGPTKTLVGATSIFALILGCLSFAAPAHADDEIPIHGQTLARSWDDTPDTVKDVLVSVHGVHRVEGATMVYYSVGYTPDTTPGTDQLAMLKAFGFKSAVTARHRGDDRMGDVAVLDLAGGDAYVTMYTGEDYTKLGSSDCVCTPWLDALPDEPEPGTAYVGAAAVPPIPEDLQTVTVRVVGHSFTNVPVEDGPMTPTTQEDGPLVVGTGWPAVDAQAINDVPDTTPFVLPLTTHQVIEDTALSERSDADSRSLDLSADVLFDIEKATLTGKAKKEIQAAADQIKDAGVTGKLAVTGHTDSVGSDSDNQDLSERRAKSVAAVLKPLLPSGVNLTTDGKGESDPVASNKTDDGKALNRRVTITLPGEK